MSQGYVLDNSVVVAAVSPAEPRHAESLAFLTAGHQRKVPVYVPAFFMLEMYAAYSRTPRELRVLGVFTEVNPLQFEMEPIDAAFVQEITTWLIAVMPGQVPTKGADLAYLGVARRRGLPLVTLDGGLHRFKGAGVDVCYPSELLARWQADAT
jgi:predicted nucleic acid-binding protein